jgi:hypothetical protein
MKKTLIAAGALALAASVLSISPANADATGSANVGSGSLLRSEFRQLVSGGGFYYDTWGASTCTTGTSNQDYGKSSMPEGNWSDVVSFIRDLNSCDVKIFQDTGYNVALTGYVNYGTTGRTVDDGLNNRTSSYYLS